jgi:hypothetical protein
MLLYIRFIAKENVAQHDAVARIASDHLIKADRLRYCLVKNLELQFRQAAAELLDICPQNQSGPRLAGAAPGGAVPIPVEDQVWIEDALFTLVLADRIGKWNLVEVRPGQQQVVLKLPRGQLQ